MATGLLMVTQQLHASSQGVSDVAIYVVQQENRKWPTSQNRVLSPNNPFHIARWTVLRHGMLRRQERSQKVRSLIHLYGQSCDWSSTHNGKRFILASTTARYCSKRTDTRTPQWPGDQLRRSWGRVKKIISRNGWWEDKGRVAQAPHQLDQKPHYGKQLWRCMGTTNTISTEHYGSAYEATWLRRRIIPGSVMWSRSCCIQSPSYYRVLMLPTVSLATNAKYTSHRKDETSSASFKEMFLASDVGGVYSILRTSSGADEVRNILQVYKQDKSGFPTEGTSLKAISFSWRTTTLAETSGPWLGSLLHV